jgi:hypothetical protein
MQATAFKSIFGAGVLFLFGSLFFVGLGLNSSAFAQLPDFLKPKNLPIDEKGPNAPRPKAKSPFLKREESRPKITFSQAAEFLEPGDVWDIFLILEDSGEDLRTLEWELRQEGPGGTTRGTIKLVLPRKKEKEGQEKFKEDDIGKLSGYLDLDTGGPDVLRRPGRFDGLRMTLTIRAVDSKGNRSEKVSFPLTLRLGAPQSTHPVKPGVSFRHRFGSIGAVFPDPLSTKKKR